jgi:hypothetical protein
MSLDIGEAFAEGLGRLTGRRAVVLVAAFVVVALASAVLAQTLQVAGLDTILETLRATPPDRLDVSRAEYDRQLSTLETQLETTRANSPLALELPASVAAAGLLVLAVVSEAVTIVAVRAFATDESDAAPIEGTTDRLAGATAHGFIGGVAVWALIIVGSILFVIPGLFAAVALYFFRQEIALEDATAIEAMTGSWRLTKGNRIAVAALGLVVVVVTQLAAAVSLLVGVVSALAASIAGAVLSGVLAAVGAAVVTQAYLQLTADRGAEAESDDPYDAALGPEDIPE